MSTQPKQETRVPRRPLPRRVDSAAVPGSGRRRLTEFDAHRWLERYCASHHAADSSDLLAGVPFN